MAIPDYQSLMLPVLSASARGEVRNREVISNIADQIDTGRACPTAPVRKAGTI